MSGALQAIFMNQRSFGPGAIGSAFAGGFYAGQIGVSSVPTHYLVVAPLSSGQASKVWKLFPTATPGADSNIDGPQNTTDITADGNSTVYPAAWFCKNLSIGGFTDWYMPAKNELEIFYYNLKPTTSQNNTSSGINPNAVPARSSNYTGGNPVQSSAAAFQSGGSEAFTAANYWSSTETADSTALQQYFGNGYQYNSYKGNTRRARAVRRIAV